MTILEHRWGRSGATDDTSTTTAPVGPERGLKSRGLTRSGRDSTEACVRSGWRPAFGDAADLAPAGER